MTEERTEEVKVNLDPDKTGPEAPGKKPVMICKILLVGDATVGKTSLLLRFANDTFSNIYTTTIGIDFRVKTIDLPNGASVKLQIWDTAGQERFRNITKAYIRGSSAICFVYNVNSVDTFRNLTNHFNPEVENQEVIKFIVGNKIERADERQVSYEDGKKFADEKGFEFRETSASTGAGVNDLFHSVAKAVYRKNNPGSALGWTGSASKFFKK
ncbi:ras-related protein Rab-13-like [Argopecten irradians]|uniref:ras-related protein Rab-13-like n=1 Tax=Argopecten irradians TaxID=31199 RepID=UPI003718D235